MNLALAIIGSIIGLGTMVWAFYNNAKYKHKQRQDDELLKRIGESIAIFLIRISYKEPIKCKGCTKTGDEESLCCQTYKL